MSNDPGESQTTSKHSRPGISRLQILTLIGIAVILAVYGIPYCSQTHRCIQRAENEAISNLIAIQTQLEMEKQISLERTYPLDGCEGAQLVERQTDDCPMSVCESFVYTSAIGYEGDAPDYCFVVTSVERDRGDSTRIIGFTIEARGVADAKGALYRLNDSAQEIETIVPAPAPTSAGCLD